MRLLLFRIAGGRQVPLDRLTPAVRWTFPHLPPGGAIEQAFITIARSGRGVILALVPLVILAVQAGTATSAAAPGWITWMWCGALAGINLIFLVIGPTLWNALLTAAMAIDVADMTESDAAAVAEWIRERYWSMRLQVVLALLGAAAGAGLLWFIDFASGYHFTLGVAEYATMVVTAGLATNALWILWWIAGLIPTFGRRPSLRLEWNNPARTPAILFLNRALWKVGAAISVGMVLLTLAVQGQPSPFSSWQEVEGPWLAAVIVEYLAFLIVAVIFVRDGVWAQAQIFRIVRLHIDSARRPVERRLHALAETYPTPSRRRDDVLYLTELDRHFDGLRTVDLKLGWAVAWGTSIFGAAVSLLASVITVSPS